ncbi:MAG: Uma2 family endonuclease [Armatimonadetes bacterium]|nr:Uma2 family endonuclease [Armatimonadota bacterium]
MTRPPRQVKRPGGNGRSTPILDLFPRQGEWTESNYFSLPETNRIIELSDGKVAMPDMPPPSHQYSVFEFAVILRAFVRAHNLGHVLVAPVPVRLWHGKIREPDVVFLSREHEDRRGEQYWGPPDLVAEVISPRTAQSSGTEDIDRVTKLMEYAQAGVREYWLVNPAEPGIEVFVLRNGDYHVLGKWGAGETARSELLPGFEIPVDSVVQT